MTVRKIFIRFCNNIRHFSNEINKLGGWISFCGGWNFSKPVSMDSTFIREIRVVQSGLNPTKWHVYRLRPTMAFCTIEANTTKYH